MSKMGIYGASRKPEPKPITTFDANTTANLLNASDTSVTTAGSGIVLKKDPCMSEEIAKWISDDNSIVMAKDGTGIALPKFVLSPFRGISFQAASSLRAVSTILDILQSTVFLVFTLTNGNGYPVPISENESATAKGGSSF